MTPSPPPAAAGWSRYTFSLAEASDGRPLCLSLCNTLHWRNSATPQDLLIRYPDLVKWAVVKGVVSADEGFALEREAETHPTLADTERRRAIALREAIARLFAARELGGGGPASDLTVVMESFNEASRLLKLALRDGRMVPELPFAKSGLELPRWQAAVSALGLLSSPSLHRVKQCADERGCGWLFLDTTRNGSRMFCFSRECGNRSRQARFRERHRGL